MNSNTRLLQGTLDRCGASSRFDEQAVLHKIKHYLPSQSALKDFIHHNTLHAFQHLKFYDAIFLASAIFGYRVTLQLSEFRQLLSQGRISETSLDRVIEWRMGGTKPLWKDRMMFGNYDESRRPRIGRLRSQWKQFLTFDLDNEVQPLLYRILCSYLDQGIATWKFPVIEAGFLESLRALESNGLVSIFRTKIARQLLLNRDVNVTQLLQRIVGDESCFEQYLFDQQFSHPGWSGICSSVEDRAEGLLDRRRMTLHELTQFELILEIDALEEQLGPGWLPLCARMKFQSTDLFAEVPDNELQQVFSLWQDALEWSYYDEVLAGFSKARSQELRPKDATSFQAIFCIDERECSLRRHLEQVDRRCETFGAPGFFGVEFFYLPENGKFLDKLCPAPITPKYLIKEIPCGHHRRHDLLYSQQTHSLIPGLVSSLTLGFWAGVRLISNLLRPRMSPAISNAFVHMNDGAQLTIENQSLHDREQELQVGFTVDEMAMRVEGQLLNMGLVNHHASLVYVVAHGSSSANNPHHGAHDCGACSGRPGSVNARVFAFMANHPVVREKLRERGIDVANETQFVGALHDTAADEIRYFDEERLSPSNQLKHEQNKPAFEQALDLNAKERSRRFASINTRQPIRQIRRAIKARSVSLFEPRPELGHGTNTICVVGRREITRELFLDRRAFLNSYDYRIDPNGDRLAGVMRPLGPVCGGINLEYYFSRIDNECFGAGTKLPHNVMGLFGVANGSDGDLRTGLPLQMIEVHDPLRLLILVEHFPEIVLKTIQSEPSMYEWFVNEWVHCVAIHPETREPWRFWRGQFIGYRPAAIAIGSVKDFNVLFENSIKMKTNQTADATRENLAVQTLR